MYTVRVIIASVLTVLFTPHKVRLQFKPTLYKTYSYEDRQRTHLNDQDDMAPEVTSTIAMRIESQSSKSTTIRYSVSYDADAKAARDVSTTIEVFRDGSFRTSVIPEVPLFIRFPSKQVGVGDTWDKDVPFKRVKQSARFKFTSTGTMRYKMKLEKFDGPCALVSVSTSAKFHMKGGSLNLPGTMKGVGSAWIYVATGTIKTYRLTLDSTVTLNGRAIHDSSDRETTEVP